VQGFVMRINAPLDALPRRCLKKPVNGSRSIQDDHRARALLAPAERYRSAAETGLRVCSRSRNSASVAFPRFLDLS